MDTETCSSENKCQVIKLDSVRINQVMLYHPCVTVNKDCSYTLPFKILSCSFPKMNTKTYSTGKQEAISNGSKTTTIIEFDETEPSTSSNTPESCNQQPSISNQSSIKYDIDLVPPADFRYSLMKPINAIDRPPMETLVPTKITAKNIQQAFEYYPQSNKEEPNQDQTNNSLSTKYSDKSKMDILKPIKRQSTEHPEVNKWFNTVDTKHAGKITAKELQLAFETFQGRTFSDTACKFVVRLLDLDKNGGIDVREFEQLYFYVKQWVNAFNAHDRERCGFLDENELDYALKYMDIHFSPEFIKFLIQRSDPTKRRMSLDQFIMTCIQIQRYTEEFKNRDENYSGVITIKYEDFLELIFRCV